MCVILRPILLKRVSCSDLSRPTPWSGGSTNLLVPLFDTKAQHQAIEPELMAAFQRVLRSGQFILGQEVQRFEETLAEFLGVRHAIGVSSGTDAILLALMALGIGAGDEVL